MEVVIRPANPADLDGIAAVHVGSWHETYAGLLPDDLIAAHTPATRRAQWARIVSDADRQAGLTVAAQGGTILGFADAGPAREGLAPFAESELYALYVLQVGQGRGIGRALTDAALASARARGAKRIGVWALETNRPAVRFYERMGFRPVTAREDRRGTLVFRDIGQVRDL